MSNLIGQMRTHISSYKTLSRHRHNCLALCDRIEDQDEEIKQYRIALNRLARLGNEPNFGNSTGNTIAQKALEGQDVQDTVTTKYHDEIVHEWHTQVVKLELRLKAVDDWRSEVFDSKDDAVVSLDNILSESDEHREGCGWLLPASSNSARKGFCDCGIA